MRSDGPVPESRGEHGSMADAPADLNLLDYLDALEGLTEAQCRECIAKLPLSPMQKDRLRRCVAGRPKTNNFMQGCPTLVGGLMGTPDGSNQAPDERRQPKATPHANEPVRLAVAGEMFGKYRLHRFLASGTFGEVWAAKHRLLDVKDARPTCLKLLYPENSNLDAALDEARLMAAVSHENVVAVKEVDSAQLNGRDIWYIEMELVGGGGSDGEFQAAPSLQEAAVKDGKPAFLIPAAVRIMAGICRGVHAAHQRQLVHRDLKPENILLESGAFKPKVTDFGIAGVIGAGAMDRGRGAARALGTPAYMAPEQARGDVSVQTDVYALGAVLYFLLAGRPPFRPSPGLTGAPAAYEILDKLRRGDAPEPLPGERQLPRTVKRIVQKAMAARPQDRYASAIEMANDLDAFGSLRPTLADPPTAAQATALLIRRNKSTAGLLAAFVLIGAVGIFFYIYRINFEKRIAKREAQVALVQRGMAIQAAHLANAARKQSEHDYLLAQRQRHRAWAAAYRAQMSLAENDLHGMDLSGARRALAHTPAMLRGWEYRYLRRAVSGSARRFRLMQSAHWLQWSTAGGLRAIGRSAIFQMDAGRGMQPVQALRNMFLRAYIPSPKASTTAVTVLSAYQMRAEIWTAARQRLVAPFSSWHAGGDRLPPLAWSPNGSLLALVGPLGQHVRICQVPGFQVRETLGLPAAARLDPFDRRISGIFWLPDGQVLVLAGNLRVIYFAGAGKLPIMPIGHPLSRFGDRAPIRIGACRPHGAEVAFGLADGRIVLEKFKPAAESRRLGFPLWWTKPNGFPPEAMAWSDGGSHLYVGYRSGVVESLRFRRRKSGILRDHYVFYPTGIFFGVGGPVAALAVSPHGNRVAAADRKKNFYIWHKTQMLRNVSIRIKLGEARGSNGSLWPMAATWEGPADLVLYPRATPLLATGSAGRRIAFALPNGAIFICNPARRTGYQRAAGIPGLPVRAVSWGDHQRFLAALVAPGVMQRRVPARLLLMPMKGHRVTIQVPLPPRFRYPGGLSVAGDGRWWALADDRQIAIGRCPPLGTPHGAPLGAQRGGAPTGRALADGAWCRLTLSGSGARAVCSAWGRGGKLAVGGFVAGHPAIWLFICHAASGKSAHLSTGIIAHPMRRIELPTAQDWISTMQFNSHDGGLIFGTRHGRIWSLSASAQLACIRRSRGSSIRSIALNPRGTRFAVLSQSSAMRFWRVGGRQEVFSLRDPNIRGLALSWLSDNRLVIATDVPSIVILNGARAGMGKGPAAVPTRAATPARTH